MIYPVDIEYEIIDVVDMHGTIIVQARDVNTDTMVSLNFNSLSFYGMTQDDISHHLVDALRKQIDHNQSKAIPQVTGKPDNFMLFKNLMLTRKRTKLDTTKVEVISNEAIPVVELNKKPVTK
jgi:hypothetical protein